MSDNHLSLIYIFSFSFVICCLFSVTAEYPYKNVPRNGKIGYIVVLLNQILLLITGTKKVSFVSSELRNVRLVGFVHSIKNYSPM